VGDFSDCSKRLPGIVLTLFVRRHIRRPQSYRRCIPDLLDCLVEVELFRRDLLEIYKQVETCLEACKRDAPNMRLLAVQDEAEITTLGSDALGTAYRTIYSETVIGYSKLVSHLLMFAVIMLNHVNSTFFTSILGPNCICCPLLWRNSTLACAQRAQASAHRKPSTGIFRRKNMPG
jgi:hypothetical protein